MKHVKENGMDAVAVTDHGAMYGAIEFFKEGKKQEVKPIIGLEGYVTKSMEEKVKDNYHITLLAKSYEGYKNLMKPGASSVFFVRLTPCIAWCCTTETESVTTKNVTGSPLVE